MSNLDPTTPDVSRRTIIKAAAWTAPAIALANVAPAYAATGGPPEIAFLGACKLPGASCNEVFIKGYLFEISITNNTKKDIYIYNEPGYEITFTESSPDIDLFFEAAVDITNNQVITFPYLLPVGASVLVILNAGDNADSANIKNVTITLTVPWGHTPTPPDPDNHPPVVFPFFVTDTPPQRGASCEIPIPPVCEPTPV